MEDITQTDHSQETHSADDHMALGVRTGRGYLNGPGLVNFPVEYRVMPDGTCIYDGCIDMGSEAEVKAETARIEAVLRSQQPGDSETADQAAARGIGLPTDSRFLWPNGVVVYSINADVPDPSRVGDAIAHIEANSAIRFVKRTNQKNYVEILSNGDLGWSRSKVGMVGGKQPLLFSDKHSWKILVHELLHAIGIYHEQSRSDRDKFVTIKWDNIDPDFVGNFQKQPGSTDYFEYDYGSIMHYGPTNFAKDHSKPVIVPKQPGVTIGQREHMSYGDRQTVAQLYHRFFRTGYSGVWRAGTGRYGLWVDDEWAGFAQKWQAWSAQGLRLHDIQVRVAGKRTLYSGVFLPGTGRHGLWANVSWQSFRDKWQEWSRDGLRLVDLNIHRAGGEDRYSGVFLPGTGGHGLWVNSEWPAFRDRWQQWSARGLRLVDINVQRVGSADRYTGVFLAGTGGHALRAGDTRAGFVQNWQHLSEQGLRLVDLNVHRVGSELRYSGAFLPGTDAHYLWTDATWESFRAKFEELGARGLRLIDFEYVAPAVGTRDVADVRLSGEAAEADAPAAAMPFGGIFGEDPAPEPLARAATAESHGGLGGPEPEATPAPETAADHGEAVFPEDAPAAGDGAVPANGRLDAPADALGLH
jgi:Astacin (Peptidase family M12A)/Polyglycine hydrolase-like, structural repeat